MKKGLLTLSVLALGFAFFVPAQEADARSRGAWRERVCNFVENREIRSWKYFNQDRDWTVKRTQRLINLQDRLNCTPDGTIAEQLSERAQFSTLVAALSAANLVDTFSGEGDFTVFAPTNAAFAALPAGTVETLLQPESIDALTNILAYHVVNPEAVATAVPSDVAVTLTAAPMLNGQDVSVEVKSGKLFINDSQVIVTDLKTSNGIVHVIDSVLLPN